MKNALLYVAFVICAILFLAVFNGNNDNYNPELIISEKEIEIDKLNEEINRLEDELYHANSDLEELKKQYNYDEDLIDLLRNQLENYGIQPYEL